MDFKVFFPDVGWILDGFWVFFEWILGVFFTGFLMDFGWVLDGFWIVFLIGF